MSSNPPRALQVPKTLAAEDALVAADALVAGLTAATHAVSRPCPPPPPLWASERPALASASTHEHHAMASSPPFYAVFGCTAAGLMAVAALRLISGPEVPILAIGTHRQARALAIRFGATDAVAPEQAREAVKQRQPPHRPGCSGIVDATGNEALETALACLADEGALACVALAYGTRQAAEDSRLEPIPALPIPLDALAERALRVSFSHGDVRALLPHALAIAQTAAKSTSTAPLRTLVTHHFSLDDAQQAFLAAQGEAPRAARPPADRSSPPKHRCPRPGRREAHTSRPEADRRARKGPRPTPRPAALHHARPRPPCTMRPMRPVPLLFHAPCTMRPPLLASRPALPTLCSTDPPCRTAGGESCVQAIVYPGKFESTDLGTARARYEQLD